MTFPKFIKNILLIALILPAIIGSYGVIEGYHLSKQKSPLEITLTKLGFNTTQQNALLTTWVQAGYLIPERAWHDLNAIKVEAPEQLFNNIKPILEKANVKHPEHFNPTILRKNFFKTVGNNSTFFDSTDALNYIIYVSQYAFDRKTGQERNELTKKSWMDTYAKEYMAAAKTLGLVDEVPPTLKEYDGTWIAGASRVGVMARIIHFEYALDKYNLTIKHTPLILAGARPLWANIDGISPNVYDKLIKVHKGDKNINDLDVSVMVGDLEPRIIEGMSYMQQLATKNNIPLKQKPFVVYTDNENFLPVVSEPQNQQIEYTSTTEMPKGFYPDRVYANYTETSSSKLTETLMSYDLLKELVGKNMHIIDTSENEGKRPTTSSTARDATQHFIEYIINQPPQEYHILYISNNPYIERQALSTQYEVNRLLYDQGLAQKGYKITIHGIGFRNKQDVATTNSELAILILEKAKMILTDDGTKKIAEVSLKVPLKDLLFQTRDHNIVTSELPSDNIISADNIASADNFFTDIYYKWVTTVRDYFDNHSE